MGMGSTALEAAVPYTGEATPISCKGQRSIKKPQKRPLQSDDNYERNLPFSGQIPSL